MNENSFLYERFAPSLNNRTAMLHVHPSVALKWDIFCYFHATFKLKAGIFCAANTGPKIGSRPVTSCNLKLTRASKSLFDQKFDHLRCNYDTEFQKVAR